MATAAAPFVLPALITKKQKSSDIFGLLNAAFVKDGNREGSLVEVEEPDQSGVEGWRLERRAVLARKGQLSCPGRLSPPLPRPRPHCPAVLPRAPVLP